MIHLSLRTAALFLCSFLIGSAHPSVAAVLRVDHAASGAGNGATWADAYADLQSALTVAGPGDEIWVAAGLYLPGTTADETVTFWMENGVGPPSVDPDQVSDPEPASIHSGGGRLFLPG